LSARADDGRSTAGAPLMPAHSSCT
jgi:hypothetical protein